MKAVSFNEYGGTGVLKVIDAALPRLKSTEVLVKVKIAGLNPGEAAIREGYLESLFHTDFPCGEGTDFAGVVVKVGHDVTKFKQGDKVAGYTLDRASQAEYVAVSEDNLVIKPDNVSWEVGGSLFVAGVTGYAAIEAVGVKANDTVIVSGAAGGVGLVAAQLALLHGARVIGIASKNYAKWLTGHGIIPIDYHDDIKSQIAGHTDKVDSFIDTVGGGYVELAIDLGIDLDKINTCIDFVAAEKYKVKSAGSAMGSAKILQELIELIADNKLDIPIAKSYSLDQVQEAYTYLANKHDVGKVLLSVTSLDL
jgi:NADPH:quinone reductase-like Zn-dependent oxidoreductase